MQTADHMVTYTVPIYDHVIIQTLVRVNGMAGHCLMLNHLMANSRNPRTLHVYARAHLGTLVVTLRQFSTFLLVFVCLCLCCLGTS